MAGFQKRAWGNNTNNQAPQQQNTTFTNSVKGGNDDKLLSINVKFGEYRKGDLYFKISSLDFKDIPLINKKYKNTFSVVEEKQPGSKYGTIYFVVKPENIENFKQILPNVVQDLKNTGHYKDTTIDNFEEKILTSLEKTPTPEEIANNDKNVITNWKELFNKLQDPETKKKFLAFQTTYTCQNSYKDAALSPSNVIEVRLADPQASFVTDISTWKNKYNRTVNPGSPFIIVTKPEQTFPPKKYLEADPIVRRNGGWDSLCKKCGGPWFGEAWAAQKRVKKQYNLYTKYYKAKVYDVRFTTPIDPNNDPFVKMANLINNLTGEVNEAAKQLLRQEAIEKGEQVPDFNAKKEGIETPEELTKFKDFIIAKCNKLKIKIPEIGTPQDIIANAVYAYAIKKAEEFNTLGDNKSDNSKGKVCFASAILYAIAHTFNIESYKVSDAINVLERLTYEEKQELYQHTFQCFKDLATFSLHESVGDITFDEYVHIFDGLDSFNSFKNKYDDLNNRMDNLYKD